MAPSGPKEQPKPKADAKPKAKAPKKEKKSEEEEKPRLEAPNYEAYQESVNKVQEQIDKLQKEAQALKDKMNEKSAGKEDFFAKKAVIRAELDEVSKQMDAIQEQKEAISKALGDKRAEGAEMKAEMGKMKKSMAYTTAEDINKRIAQIEDKMQHESLSLKDEKWYMQEIKDLKKNLPKLSELAGMQNKLAGFDAGGDIKAQRGELNELMAGLREKKKEISARLTELTEARKAQMGDVGGVVEEREARSKKLQELIAQRTALRDGFNEQKREFSVYLAEQRRIKQEKYQEDRKLQQEQWRIQKLEKQIEALDDQPHVAEITLIEQTEKWCKDLMPKDATETKEEKKETVFNNKDGEEVMASKKDRDNEMYFVPSKVKSKGKKSKGPEGDASKKPIKHNAETFKLFDSLKLDAPITTADIPAILVKLAEQKAMYEGKVKEWEENKEDMKRKIKEGLVTSEDLEEKEEAKAEEEEKES